jgi:hypothetical protein
MKKSILGLALLAGLTALAACSENPQVPVVNGVPLELTPMLQPPVVVLPPVHVR